SSLWRFASHNSFAMSVVFVYGSRHLFAPRRVTLKNQSNQNPGSASGLSRHLRRTLRRQCHCDKKAFLFMCSDSG
ncbi:hypothetical protein CU664_13100, partial [Pseudomonas syringae pv. actinidifoliorum]|nr:hypothetical protein [Pseudomonas syringae pv. actinidifoliorum]